MRFSGLRAASATALTLAFAVPAMAADAPAPRTLTASGMGMAKAVPDRAQMSTGVVSHARTAAQALGDNSRAMTAMIDTLKRAGIAQKNIQTSAFSVSPQYSEQKPGSATPPHIVGYEVTNTVGVTIDGIDKVGPAIDALVAAGANQIDGPSFSFADDKALLAQAREEAVKDATARARTYAQAAGVTLGPILSIGDGGSIAPQPADRIMAFASAAPAPPIAAGEASVQATVRIVWEIH